jgi:hypothetical protein
MKRFLAVFFLSIPLLASCSQSNKVIKPNSEGKAYQTLGVIEVTQPAKHSILARVLTFGLLKYRSFDRVKASLDAQLVRKAKIHYKAESVINVKYWPDSDLAQSTELYRARGEMIRYEPFPAEAAAVSVAPIQG